MFEHRYVTRCYVHNGSNGLMLDQIHGSVRFYVGEITYEYDYLIKDNQELVDIYFSSKNPDHGRGYFDGNNNSNGHWCLHDIKKVWSK